jgi:catechol 2,3-dioxygenase-like lactoylglutathione lyase family enzyme
LSGAVNFGALHVAVCDHETEGCFMINGAHAIVYSTDADADRAFLRDILGLPHVDVGEGWLIFGLPPSEVAVHPTDGTNGTHELYFMCDDVEQLRERLAASNVESSEVSDEGWGLVTQVTLPGGSKLGIYQPRHARPEPVASARAGGRKKAKKPVAKAGKTKAGKGKPAKTPAKKKKKKKAGKRRG